MLENLSDGKWQLKSNTKKKKKKLINVSKIADGLVSFANFLFFLFCKED